MSLLCPRCTVTFSPPDEWITVEAGDVRVGDILIRNVVPGMEWVPGPYGAYVIVEKNRDPYGLLGDDQVELFGREAWGPEGSGAQLVGVIYDVSEHVLVKRKTN